MHPFIGIDVVDLGRARALGRSGDSRFLRRVFSEHERERIARAADPDLEVWRLWASKEAAFKVVSKLELSAGRELPVFRHAAFEVMDAPGIPPSRLRVDAWELEVDVGGAEAERVRDRVVALAWEGTGAAVSGAHWASLARTSEVLEELELSSDWTSWLGDHLKPAEAEPVHSLASALVRVLARRAAARRLRVDESRLAILCPPGHTGLRPPYLYMDGELLREADVSFSHDGEFLAWAVRWFGEDAYAPSDREPS